MWLDGRAARIGFAAFFWRRFSREGWNTVEICVGIAWKLATTSSHRPYSASQLCSMETPLQEVGVCMRDSPIGILALWHSNLSFFVVGAGTAAFRCVGRC